MKNKPMQRNEADPPNAADQRNYSPPPLDWDQAVRVSRARVSEQFIEPDTGSDPRLAGEVASLAAEMCAYGQLAAEVDRLEARPDEPPVGKRAKRKRRLPAAMGPRS